MNDLIERLQKLISDRCGNGPSGPNYDPALLDVLTEAAAALEAAREDAERYRWLRDRMVAEEIADEAHAMLALRVVGPIAKRPADPDYCDELDAAIDQARGKGGQEVGK